MTTTAQVLTVVAHGTVKVGRWDYPADQFHDGTVARMTKSGDWVEADAAKFVLTERVESEVRTLARKVYRVIFDSFAAGADDILGNLPELGTEKAAAAYAAALEGTGLVVRDRVNGEGTFVWQSWQTYDDISAEEALADFEAKAPADLKVKSAKTPVAHPVTNNTHAKPGRSTWAIGSPCAQGLHVLTTDNLYVMPSGRKQCKDCRHGYASNV